MKSFRYLIETSEGIHARPATLIVTESKKYTSSIKITNNDKTVDAIRMIAVMSLNAKKGDILGIEINGEDEDLAFNNLISLFKENI